MSNLSCPKCRSEIALDDVNVANNLALCRKCGQNFPYSELLAESETIPFDPSRPPKGAWFHQDSRGFEVGVSTRSAAALFLLPFMTVWSGFSLGGIYGSQIIKGHFNLAMSLFGIPFFLGTLLFGSIAVMTVCGKVVIRVNGNNGIIFTGAGPLGFRKRFRWDEITAIRRTTKSTGENGTSVQITLDGREPMNFGIGVSSKRFDFMLSALRYIHRQQNRTRVLPVAA